MLQIDSSLPWTLSRASMQRAIDPCDRAVHEKDVAALLPALRPGDAGAVSVLPQLAFDQRYPVRRRQNRPLTHPLYGRILLRLSHKQSACPFAQIASLFRILQYLPPRRVQSWLRSQPNLEDESVPPRFS